MDASQKLEDLWWNLVGRNPELMVKLALCCTTDTHCGSFQVGTSLPGDSKRVRAARIGPHAYRMSSALCFNLLVDPMSYPGK